MAVDWDSDRWGDPATCVHIAASLPDKAHDDTATDAEAGS